MALSPQWLDELRARVTLSSVIMRTTKLQKAGHEWKACCPFHDEKSPSFTVSDQKGFYHCFGCQAHGDVISWMTDQRGLSFMDAIKELAAEAGMDVPAADPQSAARAEQKAGLHDVMQSAQSYFEQSLLSSNGSGAREYLKSRGFDQQTIERFGFGYAPPERQAMKSALSEYDEPMLIECGLRISVDDKEPYDRFRSRLMLPIHDARGRVIAFGGRILETNTKAPKYLNSPDTPLFDKGSNLYNLHRAGPASRKTNRVIVVEGYMDVIALASAGIEDAVAPMGTALTETQLEMLWRMAETPILCFDGDVAGQRAAIKAIERALPMLRPPHSLRIARLPEGKDPDDIIKVGGRGAIDSVIHGSVSAIDMLWDYEFAAQPLETPESKAGLKERLLAHTDAILHPTIRSLYRRALLQRYSEFAFPDPASKRRAYSKEQRSTSDTLKFWASNPEGWLEHKHRRLGAAIATGLILRPQNISKHAEELYKFEPSLLDKRIETLLEFYADEMPPESAEVMAFLRNHDSSVPLAKEWDELPFPFTFLSSDNRHANAALKIAIDIYYGWPIVSREIHRATDRFDGHDPDGAWKEQQRLLAIKHKLVKQCFELLQEVESQSKQSKRELELQAA